MIFSTTSRVAADNAPFRLRTILAPLVAIIIGAFMVMLDSTAMNVALPSLLRGLHGTLGTLQWTITGYVLAQAAVIPLAGWLGDRFGAKPVFLGSVALFTLGSVLCAAAPTAGILILCRVFQGLGGGVVVPLGMAYTYRLSPPAKVGAVMGMMGIPILFAPAIGPVVAGWLVQCASWRWVFLLNVPVGGLGLLVGLRSLPPIERQRVAGLDLPGIILGPFAFAALCYGVSRGSASWTSVETLGGLLVGGVTLLTFVVVELRTRTPLLELRVFASPGFSLGIVVQWLSQFVLFGVLFLVPLFLQQARGYGAFATGLILVPEAIAAAVCMPLGGWLYDRIGARPLVVAGLTVAAVACFLLTRLDATTRGPDLIVALALSGVGTGLILMTLNTYLVQASPPRLVTRVTALTNALRQVATSLSIAGLSTLLTVRTSAHVGVTSGTAALAGAFGDTFGILLVAAVVGALLGLGLHRLQTVEPAGPDLATDPRRDACAGKHPCWLGRVCKPCFGRQRI